MARCLVCVIGLILLGAGCGDSAEEKAMEKQIEKATGGDAEVDFSNKGTKITGETEQGKYTVTTGGATEIPKDFPDDVFIYQPSKAVMAMELDEGYSIAMTTHDDRIKVVGAYRQEMKARGWTEETSMDMGAQSVLVYEKKGRTANVSVVPMEGALQINMTVTTE
jgi:hypothetical protein